MYYATGIPIYEDGKPIPQKERKARWNKVKAAGLQADRYGLRSKATADRHAADVLAKTGVLLEVFEHSYL